MASTYSPLKIELITTGEQSSTWGATTNVNLGTAIEEAITGSADVTFASANVTLTLTDTNGSQTARNLRLRLTGTTGGARNLIVPAIEKFYIVQNDTADTITIKNSTGTGVAIPTTLSALVYNNGTNIVSASTYTTSVVTPLLAATDASFVNPLPVASGGTGVATATGTGSVVLATSPTLVTPALGTPTAGVLTSCTGLPLSTGIVGTLGVSNGGTGVTTSTGTGSNVLSASPALTGVPTAPTAAPGTNTTQLATTAFVTTVAGNLGTMSTQNANAVAITGGTISGTTVSTTSITQRVVASGTTSGTMTPTGDTADIYTTLGLTGTTTYAIPSGTPTNGQKLVIRIRDDGTTRTLVWTTTAGGYRVIGSNLPTATAANKLIYVGCIYNSTDSYWDVVAVIQQA